MNDKSYNGEGLNSCYLALLTQQSAGTFQSLKAGTHYLCLWAVFTGREHGP